MERELEAIFSHAVALDQSGTMKNSIFCGDRLIYILNYDKTILLKFLTASKQFSHNIGFRANDYDSNIFHEEEGKIIFSRQGAGFDRKKTCGIPDKTFSDINDLFHSYSVSMEGNSFELDKSVLELLEEGLSHIEFSSENKTLTIIQRDIYSGNIIRLERKSEAGLQLMNKIRLKDDLKEDFSPIGLRTNDLIALFIFNRTIRFFPQEGFCYFQGAESTMSGLISFCYYDQLGTVNMLPENKKEEDQSMKEKSPCTKRRKI